MFHTPALPGFAVEPSRSRPGQVTYVYSPNGMRFSNYEKARAFLVTLTEKNKPQPVAPITPAPSINLSEKVTQKIPMLFPKPSAETGFYDADFPPNAKVRSKRRKLKSFD